MERVTHIDKDGWYINGANVVTVFHSGTGEIRMRGKDIDRLAAYEETGLEPEEVLPKEYAGEIMRSMILSKEYQKLGPIDRLRELAEADREGRCVVLPAQKVFELTWDAGPDCDMACPLTIDGDGQCDFCDRGKLYVYERPCRQEHIDRIGKDIFLTREAAESALRREQE